MNYTITNSRQPHESLGVESEYNAAFWVVDGQDGFLTEKLLHITRRARGLGERVRVNAVDDLTSDAAHFLQDAARPQDFAHVVNQIEKGAKAGDASPNGELGCNERNGALDLDQSRER